jgi:anti-sigma regulatory factor (Ser/Thr protein kinase)
MSPLIGPAGDALFAALRSGNGMDMDASVLARRFPAQADQVAPARREVVAYAREHRAADPDAIALAVSEAVTNAVVHAYIDAPAPGEVEVIAKLHADDGLEVDVCDDGRGMGPRRDSPGIGVGLPLVASLAERFRIETRPGGGTAICMFFAVLDEA